MIQSLPCPACHRTLVLAAEASLLAVLRCRHCSHQFVLGEMVEAELGFWEVVDDPNAPEPNLASAVDSPVEDEDPTLSASDEYISPQMLIKNKHQSDKKNVDWSKFEPVGHEHYDRMHRKGKSPIWSMLSVLLGGLASIPIATLLIWHVLGKDPLRMGPVVGRYIPWIVPHRFQPYEPEFADENRPPAPRAGESGFRQFDSVLNPAASDPTQTPMEPSTDSAAKLKVEIRDHAAPGITTPADLSVDSLPDDEPTEEKPFVTERPVNDVFSLIHQVKQDLDAWNQRGDDREVNKKLAYETYSNLSGLALTIDELPAESPIKRIVRTELNAVGREVARHADIQQLIQFCLVATLGSNHGDRIGLALVTKVAQASEDENCWSFKPELGANQEGMQIIVPKEVIPAISTSQKLLVIGCLKRSEPTDTLESSEKQPKAESILTANFVHVLEP